MRCQAAVVAQMFFGAGFAQIAGEAFVIAVVSVGMIAAMRGMARTRTQGRHARQCGLCAVLCAGVTAITSGLHESVGKAFHAAAFILCFALLSLLMAYVEAPAAERRAGR
ncbi:MAG: hypothetical protein ACLVJB_04915 [Christensenellales bacterium]